MLRAKSTALRSIQTQRRLRVESLENRYLLSHPAVAAVNVAGTNWASGFVSYLESSGKGAGGYAIPVGSSAQLQTLPWTNVNQVRITFSEDVTVHAADLSVSGVNKTAYAFSGFSYDVNTHTATWTLDASITKDKLMLDLDADGLAPVSSAATSEVLDGAWTDCQSTYNSGNGQGGTDFQFRFNVLPGDANANNSVSLTDAALVQQKLGKSAGQTGYDLRCDVDGSGVITTADYSAVQVRAGGSLPSGNPVGMNNDAPTANGIPDLAIAAGTVDHVLTLTDFFADAETAPANLAYSIVQNSNSSLFSSLEIDSGNLTLTFADGMTGDALLTIRATDGAGLIVDTTLATHVSSAPVITDFYCVKDYGNMWTLTGTVSDADDSVAGDVVTFGGVLAGYHLQTTVREDGVFSLTVELVGLQMGTGTAQTTDPHGVVSNLAENWIIV
jgi:hypothetical protein